MLVKVCGITTSESAQAAANASADFIGFVFAPSTRQIDPLKAKEIAETLPTSIKKVGVFVNETIINIENIARIVGLDYIQLHGDETAEFANKLSLPFIKALNVNDSLVYNLNHFPADYFIIDSPGKKFRGGSGEVFDWSQLTGLNLDLSKVFLAGGLNEYNVKSAIETVRPIGVDVSSGVETEGKKDNTKIKHFLKQAKEGTN
ncbi:MAG TPA: phosphoribosylanthranilate isomerase [Alloiococcus sp.]|nr:phosphoribosylanthranilate isomerase [Alloiococcus sp.]